MEFSRVILVLFSVLAVLSLTFAREEAGSVEDFHPYFRAGRRSLATSDACKAYKGVKRVALLVADPGDFSASAENKYYVANLKKNVSVSRSDTVCGSKTFGTIMGQPVVVITTGIGPTNAALCGSEVLQCARYISEIVFSGTSGYSSQVGGVLNAEGTANPSKKVTRLGDICVSPVAINWECQLTDWTQQCSGWPNVDFLPVDIEGPEASFLYGQCIFTANGIKSSLHLSNEILYAAKSALGKKNLPKRSAAVLYNEKIYYGNMTAGTGVKYEYAPDGPRGVYDANSCAEVDGQFFYSGVPWDMLARNFTALVLNKAFNFTKTQKDVVAISAQEASGLSLAIERYNALASTEYSVPFTFVRGNSDWLHAPVEKAEGNSTSWRQIEQERDFATGYAYAIASYSSAVLTWLQLRCEALVASKVIKGPASDVCIFALNYA